MAKYCLLALLIALSTACVTGDAAEEGPSDQELAEIDMWADTADGKADVPAAWSNLVTWLRNVYRNDMSAIWYDQEYLASSTAAVDRIRRLVAAEGVDPTRTLYRATVRKLAAEQIDHSEINITLPGGTIIRLVGDPKGAGAFLDTSQFELEVGPSLCLNWTELQSAIEASYAGGVYGYTYVCHTVTERVLRALDVGSSAYSRQFRTYSAARWLWGPNWPSFNSSNPADWAVSRQCR
jgi:hypothetical protein